MMWRGNTDLKRVLSKCVVTSYIDKCATKFGKESETFHGMFMLLSTILNPNEPTTCSYRRSISESIFDKHIGAQETCYLLLELPLSDCNCRLMAINFGLKVFKQVCVYKYNIDNNNSLIDTYKN